MVTVEGKTYSVKVEYTALNPITANTERTFKDINSLVISNCGNLDWILFDGKVTLKVGASMSFGSSSDLDEIEVYTTFEIDESSAVIDPNTSQPVESNNPRLEIVQGRTSICKCIKC